MKRHNSTYNWHEWPAEEPPTDRFFLLRFERPNGFHYYSSGRRVIIDGHPHWHDYQDLPADEEIQNTIFMRRGQSGPGKTRGDLRFDVYLERGVRIFWTVDYVQTTGEAGVTKENA